MKKTFTASIIQIVRRKFLLKTSATLAFLGLAYSVFGNDYCLSGYPMRFYPYCDLRLGLDLSLFGAGFWLGWLVDVVFWFALSSFVVTVLQLLASRKVGLWRFLVAPSFLTLMGLLYKNPCDGFFCFFDGRGYPLGFLNDDGFQWRVFLGDLAFWGLIVYPLVCLGVWLVARRNKKRA